MSPDDVDEVLERGVEAGCTEALFSFGTRPEVYPSVHEGLREHGHETAVDYLFECCERALDRGLLPHSNPGLLEHDEIERLREVNASMGLMLETTAEVDAHRGFESKTPWRRLRHLDDAGRLDVPFTTGLLVGLGETWRDRVESLLALRDVHRRHGHVQEVIIQNVVSNERSDYERPSFDVVARVVRLARSILPDDVEIQVPPNLTPRVPDLVRLGVGDLGGVSPVTVDHVNPDYAWPAIERLRDVAGEAGASLVERLPVYETYLTEGWCSGRVLEAAGLHGGGHAMDGSEKPFDGRRPNSPKEI
ncbi:MAG: 7,8-didemethyl-8-hydroxy-5-deazariboflavin synthase subunit CofG, partial [Halobacteriota archaeon]